MSDVVEATSTTIVASQPPPIITSQQSIHTRIHSLTSCLVNINTHLQPELGINTMQIFQLTTLLCKHVDQLDYLLFNKTSQYVGLLSDGYQTGEYSDILFLISTWCMEVLLKTKSELQINTSPDIFSKIARAVMIQMVLSADNLLQLSEDDKKNVMIIIGMNEILNDSTLLLFPLVQSITDSLQSCCFAQRQKPNVRKNANTYKTSSQFLVKHHRH